MLIVHLILAATAVGVLALRPRSSPAAILLLLVASLDIALGAPVLPVLETVAPLLSFLAAALTLAVLLECAGLGERAAHVLAVTARGRTLALYVLVCVLCALLTAIVSLDGAVVLMVPLLLALTREYRLPFAPLFLGVIAVANAASVAVPQGNPTNLVLMAQLGLSPTASLSHMVAPGLGAAALCAGAVALREWRTLAVTYTAPTLNWTPLSDPERHAAFTLGAAALAAWLTPLLGLAPWWPFTAVVTVSLLLWPERPYVSIPWRIAAQLVGLLVATQALALHARADTAHTLAGLLAIAFGIGAASALVNNLPVSASASALLATGPVAYAASIGLAVGALATPQGSVATLIAADLAGPMHHPSRSAASPRSHAPPYSSQRSCSGLPSDLGCMRATEPSVTIDDVREVARGLPRSYEVRVQGRVKFRVGRIVWLAFSKDETEMGFAFPKEFREALVEANPEKFRMPGAADLRYKWAVVRLNAIDQDEMRDLVLDAWSMVVPQFVVDDYLRENDSPH